MVSIEDSVNYNNLIKWDCFAGYTEEYILLNEFCLVCSRILGFLLLMLYGVTGNILILILFMIIAANLTESINKLFLMTAS